MSCVEQELEFIITRLHKSCNLSFVEAQSCLVEFGVKSYSSAGRGFPHLFESGVFHVKILVSFTYTALA